MTVITQVDQWRLKCCTKPNRRSFDGRSTNDLQQNCHRLSIRVGVMTVVSKCYPKSSDDGCVSAIRGLSLGLQLCHRGLWPALHFEWLSILDLCITWRWSSWVRVGVNRYRADRSGHSSFHKLPERDRLTRKSRWWCIHQWDVECLSVWFEFTCAYVC